MSKRRYYTLCERIPGQLWTTEFGDWDKQVVVQERRDRKDSGSFVKGTEFKIIETSGAQKAITEEVALLNAGALAAKAMVVQYIPQVHCFVSFKYPGAKNEYLFDAPRQIILHTDKFVWVNGSYADPTPEGVVQVGDGRDKGFSRDGDCVLSVPVGWVSAYHDETEAEQIDRCIEVDQAMLRNAR